MKHVKNGFERSRILKTLLYVGLWDVIHASQFDYVIKYILYFTKHTKH